MINELLGSWGHFVSTLSTKKRRSNETQLDF
jgi:hypothetical protein